MRKLAFGTLAVIAALVLAGCSAGGISQEQYDSLAGQLAAVQSQLNDANARLEAATTQPASGPGTSSGTAADTDTELLIEQLSTVSAYFLWYDYYYEKNVLDQTDDLFIQRLGGLVGTVNNDKAQTAFFRYYQAEVAYRQVLDDLPPNDSAWTQEQYDAWVAASGERADALGQVGAYLYPLVQAIPWFSVQ